MKKQKKKLTTKQQLIKHRAIQYSCMGGEVLSAITPFIIMGSVNAEQWFKSENGWKVGIGGALALALMGVALWIVARQNEKDSKVTNGWAMFIIGWAALTFVSYLLTSILDQITMIMFFGWFGIIGSFGFDIGRKIEMKNADEIKKSRNDAKNEDIKEQAKQEMHQDDNIEDAVD